MPKIRWPASSPGSSPARPDRPRNACVAGIRPRTLGLVVPVTDSPQNSFYYRAVLAANRATRDRGFTFMLLAEEDIAALRPDDDFPYAGVILFAPQHDWDAQIRILRQRNVPTALVRRTTEEPGVYVLNDDDLAGGRLAMEHLHHLGHTRIALLGMAGSDRNSPGRLRAYENYIREQGLDDRPELRVWIRYPEEPALPRLLKALALDAPPTALFCYGDNLAAAAVTSLMRAGVAVPDTLAVSGYDDDPLSVQLYPSITTVGVPVEEMVVEACRLLIHYDPADPPAGSTHIFNNRLIVRESTMGIDMP